MDKHRDLKVDFILCAPPCNSSVLSWIDYATSLPSITNLKNRKFTILDINKIVSVYHNWRGKQGKTMDKKGFFKIIKIDT